MSDALGSGFLSTSGSQIVDSNGQTVRIAGINWSGAEGPAMVPTGLWARNYKDVMDEIQALGFNTIRLPFSDELLGSWTGVGTSGAGSPSGINYGKNPDLTGLNALEVFDRIVDYAGQIGLRIILDHHRSDAGYTNNENGLWYSSTYGQQAMQDNWVKLAAHYAGNSTVIGADLHNEPHNNYSNPGAGATWGDGVTATDWQAASERIGSAVLDANPDWLIFVQGIEEYDGHWDWQGGNLWGAHDHPVELSVDGVPVTDKLVYSVHEYGPSMPYGAPGWADDHNERLAEWADNWGGFVTGGDTPVLVGEFGSKLVTTADQQWMTDFITYMNTTKTTGGQGVSWTYWTINPESSDTGGIFNNDWTTVDSTKLTAIQSAMFGPFAGATPQLGDYNSNTLTGSSGNDVLVGAEADDSLSGGNGNDYLVGGTDSDTLAGGAGADTLVGGSGNDVLTGDSGQTTFRFASHGNGLDTITDAKDGDVIRIANTALSGAAGSGNGAALGKNQVQVETVGGNTLLHIGTDTVSGSDVDIILTGSFAASRFSLSGDGITIVPTSSLPTLSIGPSLVSHAEGGTGTQTSYSFTVTRSGTLTGSSSVQWAVTGATSAAASASDFVGGTLPSGTLSFASGESSKTITVLVAGDATAESDEGFAVTLASPSGATISTAAAQGLIQNDDGSGSTTVTLTGGADSWTGTGSAELVYAQAGNDTINAAGGNDTVYGDAGNDSLNGGSGNDWLYGQGDNDTLWGGGGADYLAGGDGADELYGDTGNDTLLGGSGNDYMEGRGGHDELYGGDGADMIMVGGGGSYIEAGAGNDSVFGGSGDDFIVSGSGNDYLEGGAGSDRFYVYDGDGYDYVGDFAAGAGGDVIDLSSWTSIHNMSDLASHLSQSGSAAVISLDYDTGITLANVQVSTLTSSNFIFA